jgi:flagellar basal body-associated protein FliL
MVTIHGSFHQKFNFVSVKNHFHQLILYQKVMVSKMKLTTKKFALMILIFMFAVSMMAVPTFAFNNESNSSNEASTGSSNAEQTVNHFSSLNLSNNNY